MASRESTQQQQTWVPYESAKDCSQGFCSIYCPQWCYVIFPPPPPFSFVGEDDDSSGGTTFSPLVIAIIGILASAFLLVTYYTIISKYCGGFRRRRRGRGSNPLGPGDPTVDDDDGSGGNQSHRHESWHVSPSNGLDEALINKISVYKYRRGEGFIDGTDCSVCLSEFREDDSLRLLPKCSHAFHLQCIDTWLRSHSNCPLCRANIVSVNPAPPPQLPAPPPQPTSETVVEGEQNDETVVVVIEDFEEESSNSESDGDSSKEGLDGREEDHHYHHDIIEIRDDDEGARQFRRSFSMDSSNRGRVSIADILQLSMEDELMAVKDQGLSVGGCRGSSSRGRGENGKRGGRSRSLHCVMSPVPMKRSAQCRCRAGGSASIGKGGFSSFHVRKIFIQKKRTSVIFLSKGMCSQFL